MNRSGETAPTNTLESGFHDVHPLVRFWEISVRIISGRMCSAGRAAASTRGLLPLPTPLSE